MEARRGILPAGESLPPLPGGPRQVPAGAAALQLNRPMFAALSPSRASPTPPRSPEVVAPTSSAAADTPSADALSADAAAPGAPAQGVPAKGALSEEQPGATAGKSVHGFFFDSIRQTNGWDADEESEDECAEDVRNLSGTFSCTKGPAGGIRSLSMISSTGWKGSSFEETMSSPTAIRGSKLKWVRGDNIGRGSLGTVFQAMDQETGQVFAVKEVFIDPEDENDQRFKADLENEIRICKDLSHPRIVSYLGHDYMDSCLYIYLEYMPGGSLAQVLSQFGALDESLVAVYARELLEGLEYLHTREPPVVHRDIKGGNVLVGLDCRVKLSDFGCSKRQIETMSRTMRGSIPWMAPEVIRNTGYGRTADIWSFGCVTIEMATAASPWGRFDNPMAAMAKIAMSDATPPLPDSLSSVGRDFIGLCLQRDASQRPPASKLLEHDFVRHAVMGD